MIIDFRGVEAVCLETPQGSKAIVSLYGAQVLSWIPVEGGERLYLSERAVFRSGNPVRGGIPVIFPQFSDHGDGQRHGFVRLCDWTLREQRQQADFATASFCLEDDEFTRSLWPSAFAAELTVMIEGNRLDVELEISNRAEQSISFTAALHSYLRLGNVELARLEGLEGSAYLDARDGNAPCLDNRHALLVDDEIDRIYTGVTKPLLLSETGRQLVIEQTGFCDVVVWNPWEARAAAIPDMAPLDFKRMLCVEAAMIERPIVLKPGENWCGRQTMLAL